MRLFFAVPLAQASKERLAPLLDAVRAPGLSVEKLDKLHFTLAFLGEQPSAESALRAGEAVRSVAPFELGLEGSGAFPDVRRARVIWLGVSEGRGELCGLAGLLGGALREQGIALEERAFHPHLTLARVKPGAARAAAGALGKVPGGEVLRLKVNAVHLVHSVLGAGSARHVVVREFRLQGTR